ncbi:NADH dehydrogenase [ubiquinone] iron-sulfur protein 6, mitochondrial [Microplitis demolitor]|uniref:NADH dehydrogenase [ubiquinone] iron-sulfur protein 6, mitochondrial n=1 Tax=Microplitis demolitor TaxID=69319 RepID=UPI0004CDC88E|nr:NADH dehydrogenase [ubiquinone] iron-sulfur protein 6, mitochondrial [Microplitis demolitor]
MAGKQVCCFLNNSNKFLINKLPISGVISRSNSSWEPKDVVTHTGQKFDPEDRRLVRFVDRPKEVNERWAINLINEVPPEPRPDRIVSCDGGGGPLGHPKVYINLDKPGNHICGYCGLRFYKEDHHH